MYCGEIQHALSGIGALKRNFMSYVLGDDKMYKKKGIINF